MKKSSKPFSGKFDHENTNWKYSVTQSIMFYMKKVLDANQILLWSMINGLSNKYGYCYSRNEFFAEVLDLTPTMISIHISDLIKKGFIERLPDENITFSKGTFVRRKLVAKLPTKVEMVELFEKYKKSAKGLPLNQLKGPPLNQFKVYNDSNYNDKLFTNVNKDDVSVKHQELKPPEVTSKSRLDDIREKVKSKEPKFSKEVETLFDYFVALDIIHHRKTGQFYTTARHELKMKLKIYSAQEILQVFDTYKECWDDIELRPKLNKGEPIRLDTLLNNKYGKFDWFDYFLRCSYQEIKDGFFKPRIEDPHPEITTKVADAYAQKFQGKPKYSLNGASTYDAFMKTGSKVKKYADKCKGSLPFGDVNKVIEFLMDAMKENLERQTEQGKNVQIHPWWLCSDMTWREVFPTWIEKHFPSVY